MTLTIQDYIELRGGKGNATTVVLFPNIDVGAKLISYHKEQGHNEIVVSKFFDNSLGFFPMPGVIVKAIQLAAEAADRPSYVVGIDTYLLLLDANKVEEFYSNMLSLVDKNRLTVTFFCSTSNSVNSIFQNPKYSDGMQLLTIKGEKEPEYIVDIIFIPGEWGIATAIKGISGLMGVLGNLLPNCNDKSNGYIVAIEKYSKRLAGVSNHIAQMLSPIDYLRNKGMDIVISEDAAIKLLSTNCSLIDGLTNIFGEENINNRLALKRLLEIDDELWQAYAWMLKKRLSSASYISFVLFNGQTKDRVLRSYIVDCALQCIGLIYNKAYARERAEALLAIGEDAHPLVAEFVSATQKCSDVDLLPWLNVGTDSEKEEIVRRASISDFGAGIHPMYSDSYPALGEYLANYSLGDETLSTYFADYRKFKISNSVTNEFANRAFNSVVPSVIASRDSSLQDYSSDTQTALLIVDGMGAEYFSLIVASSRRKGLAISSAKVVSVRLPTSTKFNKILWPKDRLLDEVKGVDNLAHQGAEKHEKNSTERNVVAAFERITSGLMKRISSALTTYQRVIVTADHGATRLGVIAHNNKIGTTLEYSELPDDWRYCKALSGEKRPSEFAVGYHNGADYCVVRGYNRLPKKGPKLYEMHGGATLEEIIVPFIVYKRGKVTDEILPTEDKPSILLVEKDDFDV